MGGESAEKEKMKVKKKKKKRRKRMIKEKLGEWEKEISSFTQKLIIFRENMYHGNSLSSQTLSVQYKERKKWNKKEKEMRKKKIWIRNIFSGSDDNFTDVSYAAKREQQFINLISDLHILW